MKLLKQPFFLIGIIALIAAIGVAVVSSAFHPSSSVLDKFEKALNNRDGKLLASCMDPKTAENTDYSAIVNEMDSLLTLMGINGEAEFEFLIGEAESVEDSEDKILPTIIVIKVDDKIIQYSTEEQRIIKIDGKEYLGNE